MKCGQHIMSGDVIHGGKMAMATERPGILVAKRKLRYTVAETCRLFVLVALGVFIFNVGVARAAVEHEEIGTFGEVGEGKLIFGDAVDNSGGPSGGDVYVAEFSFEGPSTITKYTGDGTPTGVQIAGGETPDGGFSFLSFADFDNSGIAVDPSSGPNSGDLYVADSEHNVVDKFDETGKYICQITGEITPSNSECDRVGGSDTPAGGMNPTGVVVASDGDVYVADAGHSAIDIFGPAGEYLSQITDAHITMPGSIGLDSDGNLYVANALIFKGVENIIEFNAKGEFERVVDENGPLNLAVDANPTRNRLDGGDTTPGNHISEYDSSGKVLTTFGEELSVSGLSVNDATGDIYATVENHGYIFGPAVVLPEVITDPAVSVQSTTAEFTGEVTPDTSDGGGEIVSCQFEYGTSTSYGNVASCSPATPYASATAVNAQVSLKPSTEYHFRLKATEASGAVTGGTSYGEDETMVTFGPPGVSAESSMNAVVDKVTLAARIDAFGFATTCAIQYVDDAGYQASGYTTATTLPCESSLAPGFGDQGESIPVEGLRVGTLYHYRFVATNSAGTTLGPDETFATFGVKTFAVSTFNKEGGPYTQAGGHPYSMTTNFTFNTTVDSSGQPGSADANPKGLHVELPPGLIGNPQATAKCKPYDVAHADCSGAAQVGILTVVTANGRATQSPIYNLVPPSGMAAQFGARFNGFVTAHINARVRTGGDYGVTADALYLSADEGITGATTELWGVPADPSHDAERYCPAVGKINEENPCQEHGPLVPFLSNSTACSPNQRSGLTMNSWQDPEAFVTAIAQMPQNTGCEKLDFSPNMTVLPEVRSTDSPTGLQVDLHIPQNEDPNGLAEANLKGAQVTLPAGFTVNPSGANGVQGCAPSQVAMSSSEPADCPDSSRIGSVEVRTPLVDHPLKGSVYLATQGENPFHSLIALYIAVSDAPTGVVIKLAGRVSLDPLTGQITTSFDENPQLPFEDLELNLFGGPRAPLATAQQCGGYSSDVQLTSWASQSATPVTLGSPFTLTSGVGGAACSALGFSPTVVGGTITNQAGGFSPFTLTFSRHDGEQRFSGVSVRMPEGIEGILAGVPRCGEAQANDGSCPAASQIGHVTVAAGVGPDPITLPGPGKPQDPVYLTGPYHGAPFGLSIVVPAEAGPFNLDENGKPIVVRAKIEVDPSTAQVSVVSDPLPTILQGVPADVQTVNVTVDKERFLFNPTDCKPMSIDGTFTSTQGTQVGASSRFQAAGCASLGYKPAFDIAAGSKFNRKDGVGLTLRIKPVSGQANTDKVRLVFPKQLPTRLTTLKLACLASVFDANPAACPHDSIVGEAVADTQVLSSPLKGPIYLVSHGSASFPDAEIVLQGEGVELVMDGKTEIKKGITSSTFEAVPDAPFKSFVAHLPAGPHSAFAAVIKGKKNGSLCGHSLSIKSIFVGQNNVQLKRSTKIAVSGCTRHAHKVKRPKKK